LMLRVTWVLRSTCNLRWCVCVCVCVCVFGGGGGGGAVQLGKVMLTRTSREQL
jgi:hypothetical protein